MYIPAGRNSITIAGIGNPTFDTCLTRGKGIYLNENQHISFEDVTGSCFGDVAKCNLGITFVLNLKLRNQTSKCYVFSNGGEEATNYGYAMWFENNKLYVRISTKRLEWMTYTSAVKMEELIQIEMSWSRQKGIQLRINKETKAASNQCISRPAASYTVNKDFVVGGSSKGDNGCLMILEYFTVVYAFRDIVNGTGILPDLGTHCDRNTTEEVQCQAAVQMTSTDIAFVSTFGIASALFACIIILFIFIG
ncbi:uncharacterized protein LOC134260321 [Saccostrea cucullata]|uniref:uncharacterized protein LOC134260321 n=1 Tax=Saccostrea cuccullata TaxID=36930 RepID=UPI002ED18B1F